VENTISLASSDRDSWDKEAWYHLLILATSNGKTCEVMKQVSYSKDVDALLIELSNEPIAYAEDEGQVILLYSQDAKLALVEIPDFRRFMSNETVNALIAFRASCQNRSRASETDVAMTTTWSDRQLETLLGNN
jgi:hypothetical protein